MYNIHHTLINCFSQFIIEKINEHEMTSDQLIMCEKYLDKFNLKNEFKDKHL